VKGQLTGPEMPADQQVMTRAGSGYQWSQAARARPADRSGKGAGEAAWGPLRGAADIQKAGPGTLPTGAGPASAVAIAEKHHHYDPATEWAETAIGHQPPLNLRYRGVY
jgi:hypothetical protein